jgi:hypothetical protein
VGGSGNLQMLYQLQRISMEIAVPNAGRSPLLSSAPFLQYPAMTFIQIFQCLMEVEALKESLLVDTGEVDI